MKLSTSLKKIFCLAIAVVIFMQIAACGTLIYPERRGQKAGKVDIQVAILNSIGLLFFLIPGVIAFAVDFSTGAIFLPSGRKSSTSDSGIKVVKVNPTDLTEKTISEIIAKETSLPESSVLSRAKIYRLNDGDDIKTKLVEMKKAGFSVN